MIISGFDKLSLVNFDNEISSTIFTLGCNFRCPFCQNFEFVVFDEKDKERYKVDEEEVISYLDKRKSLLSAVVITGGEPTMWKDLKAFIGKIKALGLKVKLDTNGSNPDVIENLFKEGLIDYVAMDVKNSLREYKRTAGIDESKMEGVERSIEFLKNGGYPYEFRTTLVRRYHTRESIEEMGKMLEGAKKIFLQKFVMSDNVPDRNLSEVEEKDAIEFKRILEKYIEKVELRGYGD